MALKSIDALLGPCGDLKIENGDLVKTTGADLIRQLWLIRVRVFKGEWVLDVDSGVPYVQEVLAKSANNRRLDEIFRDMTLATPGVLAVQSIAFSEIDVLTRTISVTVEAVIEGPESAVFHYSGALGVADCVLTGYIDLPLTFPDLYIWLDGQDLGNLTYAPPSLVLDNKAGAGEAGAVNGVTLEGVSALGNKRSPYFDWDDDDYLRLVDTEAIRHGNGALSVFVVARLYDTKPTPYSTDETMGLLSLDGYDPVSGESEYYNFGYQFDGTLADSVNLILQSARDGDIPQEIVTTIAITKVGTHVFQFDIDDDQDVYMYVDGALKMEAPVELDTIRLLTGDGYVAAWQESTGPEKFFNGNIGEVLVYARRLDADESSAITSFLTEKWSV